MAPSARSLPPAQGLWVGRRVPEVDDKGAPILYRRYTRVEEVLLVGWGSWGLLGGRGSGWRAQASAVEVEGTGRLGEWHDACVPR